jgi:transposase-like protein
MSLKIQKICHYFCQDLTAVQTAYKLKLSRQTINYYFKMIRDYLNYEPFLLSEKIFCIEYIKIQNRYFFYICSNNKIYLIEENSKDLTELNIFIKDYVKKNLLNNSKRDGVRIIYNKNTQNFTILGYYISSSNLQNFVINRLKKFRGIKKENLQNHIKESFFRFNHSIDEINQKISTHFSIL